MIEHQLTKLKLHHRHYKYLTIYIIYYQIII